LILPFLRKVQTMLDARVRNIVSESRPNKKIAFLIDLDADAELNAIRAIGDLGQRRAAMRDLYERTKTPIVDLISSYSVDGLHVTNQLDGSMQFIAEGPARVWQKVIGENIELFERGSVDLVPNDNIKVAI
jgi:hypothetical protein